MHSASPLQKPSEKKSFYSLTIVCAPNAKFNSWLNQLKSSLYDFEHRKKLSTGPEINLFNIGLSGTLDEIFKDEDKFQQLQKDIQDLISEYDITQPLYVHEFRKSGNKNKFLSISLQHADDIIYKIRNRLFILLREKYQIDIDIALKFGFCPTIIVGNNCELWESKINFVNQTYATEMKKYSFSISKIELNQHSGINLAETSTKTIFTAEKPKKPAETPTPKIIPDSSSFPFFMQRRSPFVYPPLPCETYMTPFSFHSPKNITTPTVQPVQQNNAQEATTTYAVLMECKPNKKLRAWLKRCTRDLTDVKVINKDKLTNGIQFTLVTIKVPRMEKLYQNKNKFSKLLDAIQNLIKQYDNLSNALIASKAALFGYNKEYVVLKFKPNNDDKTLMHFHDQLVALIEKYKMDLHIDFEFVPHFTLACIPRGKDGREANELILKLNNKIKDIKQESQEDMLTISPHSCFISRRNGTNWRSETEIVASFPLDGDIYQPVQHKRGLL